MAHETDDQGAQPARQSARTSEIIIGPTKDLIVRIASGFTIPDAPKAESFRKVTWGNEDITSLVTSVDFSASAIKLVCAPGGDNFDLFHRIAHNELRNQQLQMDCINTVILAKFACVVSRNRNLIVDATEWTMIDKERRPRYWIGQLDRAFAYHPGNLATAQNICNFHLRGHHYTYYILSANKDKPWFIIDLGTEALFDRDIIWHDFLALEFLAGQRLNTSIVYSVDEQADILGSMAGFSRGQTHSGSVRPPIPRRGLDLSVWEAPMFRALSACIHTKKEYRITAALHTYIDSVIDDMDTSYLRLQVALESLAFHYLGPNAGSLLVESPDEWEQWVFARRSEILGMVKQQGDGVEDYREQFYKKVLTAWKPLKPPKGWDKWVSERRPEILAMVKKRDGNIDQQLADKFYAKVSKAYEHASRTRVEDAFRTFGLSLTAQMIEEIELRDVPVHQGTMSPEGYDVDRDTGRIALIRSLLIALTSKIINYQGAIIGWEYSPIGELPSLTDWWPIGESASAEAKIVYRTETNPFW